MLVNPRRITIESVTLDGEVNRSRATPFLFDSFDYRKLYSKVSFEKDALSAAGITISMATTITMVNATVVDWKALDVDHDAGIDSDLVELSCWQGIESRWDEARDLMGNQTATILRGTWTGRNLEMGIEGTFEQNVSFVDLPVLASTPKRTIEKDRDLAPVDTTELWFTFQDIAVTNSDRIAYQSDEYAVFETILYPESPTFVTARARTV